MSSSKIVALITVPISLVMAGFLCATPIASFSTPVPTRVPPPTATTTAPAAPLVVEGCLHNDACAFDYSIYSLFGGMGSIENNVAYPATVSTRDRIRFFFGWCTLDQAALDENMANMVFVFNIDGVSHLDQMEAGYYSMLDENDESISYPCYAIGGVLSGFRVGETHQVEIGARFQNDIFDGWDNYEAGPHLKIFLLDPTDTP